MPKSFEDDDLTPRIGIHRAFTEKLVLCAASSDARSTTSGQGFRRAAGPLTRGWCYDYAATGRRFEK